MKVDVYYNLHKDTFSIKHKGKVIKHTDLVVLKDSKFVVSEKGRQRVLRDKRKNVHAVVRGELELTDKITVKVFPDKLAFYDPYKTETFVDYHTGEALEKASLVILEKKQIKDRIIKKIYYNE